MNSPKPTSKNGVRWSLDDLLPDGIASLDNSLDLIESSVKAIESYRPKLSEAFSVQDFLELLRKIDSSRELTSLISAYAYLRFAENTQDSTALSLQDRINQMLSSVDNRIMFFSLWFKSLPYDRAAFYIASSGDYRYYLESLRRFKPYTLSEPEEKIINLKDTNGVEALVKIYEILTNKLTFTLEVDGQVKKLTRDGLTQYFRHPSPEVRAATYQELYRVFGDNRTVLAQIYSYLVRDWGTEGLDMRGYSSPISIRNLANNIPDSVVDVLLETCRTNASLFQRYFLIKARMLGMEKLRRYDIYAPIAQAEKSLEFEDGKTLVLESFNQFSPQLARAASMVFEQSHLDSEIRPGKRGGAFSYSPGPRFVPWVLVNYNNRIRDVTTLAHELGHSIHSILASKHSILTFRPPLPLAETASVFAEMLITDRLLHQESDPYVKRDLLMTILDDAYATVERQAFISIFERDAHEKIAAGGTSEDLANLYLQNLDQQFGQAVELTDEFAWEWLTIPHIYNSPFYPYSYSFGQLLVLALYQHYLEDQKAFIPRYLKLLGYGGSAEPKEVLSEVGLDITSSEFWQAGFDVLRSKLELLEQITGGHQ